LAALSVLSAIPLKACCLINKNNNAYVRRTTHEQISTLGDWHLNC
jgi:hypothetical protein